MINYPTKRNAYQKTTNNNTASRGMALEDMLNRSNDYYRFHNIAYVNKRPTPVKILKTEDNYKIVDAVFLSPSTLDYVGVYKGHYLDFEAKETLSKKGFPMANIASHQLKAMEEIANNGGFSFAIIFLKSFNEIYFLDSKYLLLADKNKTSIIPHEQIQKEGILLKEGYNIVIDYIKAINEYYLEKK